MDKNSIIGFVLIFAILMGFSFMESRKAKEQKEIQMQLDSIAKAEAIAAMPALDSASTAELTAAVEASPLQTVYKDSSLENASKSAGEIFALENSRIRVEFNTKGAQPHSVLVKDYFRYDSTELYLFRPGEAEYSISLYAGEQISTKDFNFEVAAKTDSSIVMRLPFTNGGYLEQKYVLHEDSYAVDNQLSFVGIDIPRNVSMYDMDFNVLVPRMEKGYKNESQYSKLTYYFEGDKKPVEMGRGRNGHKRIDSKFSWFAFDQQFFSVIMRAPQDFASGELSVNFLEDQYADGNLMLCDAKMRNELNRTGDTVALFEFYFGPNHFNTLKSFGHKYEKVIPLGGWLVGWFTRYAIIPMFNFFHKFIDNFGLIILLMTLVIKIVVMPFTNKSFLSSAKMAALKPEIEKINARYPKPDDAMKKQQATMELYKKADVSPMGGCLPTLLTFPILWAMFRFFPASIELRQQSFLWCHDLSAYDSILDYGTRIPLLGDHLSLFALLMAVTMWGYSKMTMQNQPNADDPNAKSMQFMTLWMMPIMMFFICNNLSAALSYYYLLSQVFSIVQNWVIRKFFVNNEAVLAKVKAAEGKPMKKSKWQQRLEEAQKMQEAQLRAQQKNRK